MSSQQLITLTNWTARGAYSDWQRIEFLDGFAFPHGTNLLTSVTFFAWGEIRENIHSTPTLYAFPAPLSLEPGVSACAYGLTSSDSFLISWQNVCVNRSPTNRVDASIELFANGTIAIPLQRPGKAPSTLHQAPLYLVCGPYKIVVTSPGTYSFPLEVFKNRMGTDLLCGRN